MPRFIGNRDFEFIQRVNREIVVDMIDVTVVIYKIIPEHTKANIYGESLSKVRYTGTTLPALIKYEKTQTTSEGFGPDTEQRAEFRFVRRVLEEANLRPEMGDIIQYNGLYYEIDNTNETQLIGSRPEFVTSIVCHTHLTRRSHISVEPRQV